jgi:hypothetical protein
VTVELANVDATLAAGIAHHHARRDDEAANCYRRVLTVDPTHPDALRLLAVVARDAGDLPAAAELLRRAMAEMPDAAELRDDLSLVERRHAAQLQREGRFADSLAAWRRAVDSEPGNAGAHHGLAESLLLNGHWREGWREYEWRWRLPELPRQQEFRSGSEWDGSPLCGRTLLLYEEQGFGDVIQFSRLLAPVRERRDGRIVVACRREVGCLLDVETIGDGDPLPPFDVHLPLMSLARVLNVTPDSIPGTVPYITADAARARLREMPGRKVGIAWAGRPEHSRDNERSIPPALLAPLLDVPGVSWVSVAKDHRPPPGVLDLSGEIRDFRDTAAILASLDLLVTVDTAVAHLAGAMGVPTWVMLPHVPDWRWLLDRDDSPWYPSVRLFRQTVPGDWPGVIDRIRGIITA